MHRASVSANTNGNAKISANVDTSSDHQMLSLHDVGGFVYKGNRSQNCDLKDGFGCFTNGKIAYHGQWSNGVPNGLGCLATSSYVYYGQIRQGRINGFGQMSCKENTATKDNNSTETSQDGCVSFAGQFINGSPNGPGVVVFHSLNAGDDAVSSDFGLPRREGIFRGTQLLSQSLQPQAVRNAIRCAKQAQAIVSAGSGGINPQGIVCDCKDSLRVPNMLFVSLPN